VTFPNVQNAADLNVVTVGWNDTTSSVTSVTDSQGNTYTRAVGPTTRSAVGTLSIYYAKNIVAAAAGSNTVTVAFSAAVPYPDVRIAEYNGADPTTPVDVTVASTGSSTSSSSGSKTTTNAKDLLVGANYVATGTTGAGSNFTSRIITQPDGDILEDRMVTATGSYSATAPMSPSGGWVMQMVAFRAVALPTAPTSLSATPGSNQISLTWTASTSPIGIANYIVQRCQGSGCSNYAQVATPTGTTYTDTSLASNTSYSYRVEAVDTAGNTSSFSNVATATTQGDTQPPTAPTNLTATAAGQSQINLTWSASTDNVGVTGYLIERCQGVSCTTFAQTGTSATTSYSNTGLTVNTSYSYRVRATDAAGNLSGYSNTASATTQADTQPPTAPTTLTATAISTTQISLGWTASTDNIGVTNYLIERCQGTACTTFTQIGTSATTSYSDTGLTVNTSYSYRVRATDAAGNLSGYSNTASATTQADTQPPTAPTTLTATVVSTTQISLGWTASTDNIGVTNYLIERCQGASCTTFTQIGTSATTSYSDTGLTVNTSYSYRVRATDAAGNLSNYSNTASATTSGITISYVQSNYATPQTSSTSVNVAFPAAQRAGDLNVVAVAWYSSTSVRAITDSKGNTYALAIGPTTSSSGGTQSIYYAKNIAAAAAGANTVIVTFSGASAYPDVRAVEYSGADPTNPLDVAVAGTGNTATTNSGSTTTSSASDLLFAANYVDTGTTGAGTGFTSRVITQPDGDIVEDRLATTPGSYSATAPINPAGTWIMQMAAFRPATGGNTPPTPPTNLTGTAISSSRVNLTWSPSNSNIGVSYYNVQRCQGSGCATFAQIGTSATTNYSDTGLTASTTYTYQVQAVDVAGNLSTFSSPASATTLTPDNQPPTQPTNLTATPAGASQINLNWTASTDNVGVTGYFVEQCQGANCTTFTQIATVTSTTYASAGLQPNSSYTFRVRATDAAGNLSSYSNLATASTTSLLSGLVAAYSFDEGTGTTITDSSGNGNNGLVSDPLWVSGKYGSAVSFSSASTLVTIPDTPSLHLGSAMTLEAWVNLYGVGAVGNPIIYKGYDSYYLDATTAQTVPGGGGTFGSTDLMLYGTSPLSATTWTHLAVTYDGSTIRLYVNGNQVSSKAQTGSILGTNRVLQIGGASDLFQSLYGVVDEVRVYNIALTQTQIQSDMTTSIGSNGTVPIPTLSPSSLTFGSQTVGTTSAAQQLTLGNKGGVPLTINSIAIVGQDNTDFSQTNNCGGSVAPNGSCAISVTFTPTATGTQGSTVTVSSNATTTPQAAVIGVGAGFSVSPQATGLTYTETQQFTASSPNATWAVDGVAGGSAATGTITASGLYTPPSTPGMHTITATTTNPPQSASATAYITNYAGTFTHHNDNFRTGQNLNETMLSPANVNASQFGKLFTQTLDGLIFASPLYVASVNMGGNGFHNLVYVATEHDSVYAFDADSSSATPLWKTSFINPAQGVTSVPSADTGEPGDIPTEIGITGTPVIDPTTNTIYVVAKTKEVTGGNTNYVQRLHALDITTGAEKFGGPVVIQASVAGTGSGSSGGQVAFNALAENQRPGLLLSNGTVYIGFGSHGDYGPWHGWIIGYNAVTLQQTMAYNVTPNSIGGGVWQSGGGLAADASGNIYYSTGNGGFDVNTGGADYGEAVQKISPTGAALDYFAPWDQASLSANNLDLSSAGPVLLVDQTTGPVPHLMIVASKNGTIYVLNRDNMGHFNSTNDNQIVQSLVSVLPNGNNGAGNYSSPAYFNGYVYFGAVDDNIKAFQLANGLLSTGPTSQSGIIYPHRGASFAISANGSTNGILWAVQDNSSDSVPATATLHAYDALNLSHELYNSATAGSRDTLGTATKFSIPLIANGKVYVAAQNQLVGYSLLP
jgi:chitodextrinase